MKQKKKNLFATLFLVLAISTGYTQETTNVSGGNALGNGGSMAYSIGQVIYTTNIGTGGSVNQGVQQTYEILNTGIKETALKISLTIFPNPTTNNLTLQVQDFTNEELTYQLLNMQGKLLGNEKVTGSQTQISTSALQPATYLIKITQGNESIQTFKIIKK